MSIFTNSKTAFSKLLKQFILMPVFVMAFFAAAAQVPANDEPCNAIALTPATLCTYQTFTNVDATATTTAPAPTCGNFTDSDVWFRVVMPASGAISVDTRDIVLTDGAMSIYSGTCTALVEMVCADDGSVNPGMPFASVTAPAGSTVWIRVWGFGGETGAFGICVRAIPAPPVNDNCPNAIALTVNPDYLCGVVTAGTTEQATLSSTTPNPTCGATGINDDVWYTFVATNTGHRVSLLNVVGSVTDMAFAVYSGTSCANLVQVICSDPNTANLTGLIVGNTYWVRVYTFTSTAGSFASFNICIGTPPPPPPNDACSNAISLTVNPTLTCTATTNGTTESATLSTETPGPTCGTLNGWNDDVWFSFVATGTAHRITLSNVLPAGTAMTVAVYSGTCGALTQVGCLTGLVQNVNGLTPGQTYLVRVYTNVTTATTTATFTICVASFPAPPANDECAGAINLPVNPDLLCGQVTAGSTISATTSADPAPTCNAAGINDDVWYSFVATGPLHRISLLNVTGDVTALTIVAYSGTCGSLTQIGCIGGNILNLSGLVAGQTYIVRVYTNVATAQTFASYNICVGTYPAPPPNDECANAITLTVNPDNLCGIVTAGNTISSTQSTTTPNPTCGNVNGWNDDVWFQFTATGPVHRVSLLNVAGDVTAMVIVAYSGTCAGGLTQVGCIAGNVLNLTGLTGGQTYLVRVYTNSTTAFQFAGFNICVGTPPPPPSNDEPCTAIFLTTSATACNYQTFSNESSNASAGVPAPNCANYLGGDVWFKVEVPPSGNIQVDTQVGIMTDGGMAFYSGTCNNLTLIECDDNDSPNGLMPMIDRKCATGLTPGDTIWVRVWEFGNDNQGTFGICSRVSPPQPGPLNNAGVCSSFQPFCTGTTYNFPSVTGVPSTGGQGVYDCLFTTPNPVFFYMQIQTAGTLNFNISQQSTGGGGIDVDFAIWGPFTSLSSGCTILQSACPPLPVDCSYSTAAVEPVVLPNTQVGEFYIILITNFNGGAGTITFNQTGGTGTTNCNIVCSATASNNGPACPGGTFNLTASSSAPGATYSWTGPGGFTSNVQNPTGVTAPATVGNYVYTVTVTAGANTCTGNTTLQVIANPPAPTVTSPVTYCQNAPAVPLTATGTNLLWYTTATGGVGSATAPTPSTATLGSTNYFVSQSTNGGCEGPRAQITVNVVAALGAPTVTSPVTYCQGQTATALTATGSNLLWYTTATGGTGSATAPIPSTTTPGSTNYYVSQTSGSCESPRATITVNVTATPAAPTVTTPVLYCQNATPTQLSATGTGLLWYTTATGGTGSATAPTPSTTTPGTTNYYVSQTVSGCESPRAVIAVTVTANPVAPTVTSPVQYCQNATAVPLTATGSNLLWYTVPTGGTGSSTAPTPSTATIGSTTYYVSQTVNGCQGPRASIVVNVVPAPAQPEVISPVTYCQGQTATALTATGTNLMWYTTATGGTGSTTAPTPSTATAGSTTYYVSQNNGSCEGPRAAIVVNVNPTPGAPTVTTPITYCQNAVAVPLTATGTNLLWYTTPTGGTGSTTAPTPSTTTAGSTSYYVSQTTGACQGPRAEIVVTVIATPAAPTVTTPVVYCQGATATPLAATGTGLLWYTTATGGTGSSTAPTPSTATVGSTNYYVSQSTGTCEGPRATITVTINTTPPAPGIQPRSFCQNATATALTATGTGLLWYTTATGGTGTAVAPVPSTSTPGVTTFYVSQTVGTCEGPRAALVVTVSPTLTVNAGPDQTIGLGTAATLTGTASQGTSILWTANPAPGNITSPTSLTTLVSPTQTTTYTLTVTDPTSLCPSRSDDVVVTVFTTCIDVKNAFSPNGDGVNDQWRVYDQFACLRSIKVIVYNRYGSKVYENSNYRNEWNGTFKGQPIPDGTYYAVIEFTLSNGTIQYAKTDVTILR